MKRIATFFVLFLILSLSLSLITFAIPIPDTGQTQSYIYTFGEDSDYSIHPQSYTKSTIKEMICQTQPHHGLW